MTHRWRAGMIGGLALLSLAACADSLHQTQRLEMMVATTGSYGVFDDYPYAEPFYGYPGFWGSPFGYYGFYGPGYGYGYPYYYGYYRGRPSGQSGPAFRPAPPSNAPRQFLKRR